MALSANILTVVLIPLILTCSLILLPLAIFSTTIAISTLAVRVLVVYVELAAAVASNYLSSLRSNPSAPILTSSPAKRPRSARSMSTASSGSQTPKPPSILGGSSSSGVPYAPNSSLARDFEGVGGWRFAGEDNNDEEWVTLNARLELPAVAAIPEQRKRNHRRSLTHGALGEKLLWRRKSGGGRTVGRPKSAAWSGSVSPEGKLRSEARTKSAVFLGGGEYMNVGKPRGRGRRKSESSESSGATLTLQAGGGK